ncbi:MAG: helix-turn-helix domain-containing protein [Brevundimonas sp.]
MRRKIEEAPPTWFRLSEASWDEIRAAYRNGATAKDLAVRWKVSPGTIYRHACAGGWTKKRSADAEARAHAAAIAEEERVDQTRPDVDAGLFAPPGEGEEALSDPAALAAQAMTASARAMRARLFADAEKLARLAEAYGRMAERAAGRGASAATIETLDLQMLSDIIWDDSGRVRARFDMRGDDAVNPVKAAFHDRLAQAYREQNDWMRRVYKQAGLLPEGRAPS